MVRIARFAALVCAAPALAWSGSAAAIRFQSSYVKAELAADQPAFRFLAVDSLGKNKKKLKRNLLHEPEAVATAGLLARRTGKAAVEYRLPGDAVGAPPAWAVEFSERGVRLRSARRGSPPFVINFNNQICHATLLGHINDDGTMPLPALMHMPDWGTVRIGAKGGESGAVALGYRASRGKTGDFVRITFPGASGQTPVEYTWDVVAIYPGPESLAGDRRFDGYRRNFLTIFQINPQFRTLANHSASDPAALTFFQYSAVAKYAPPLADGLTAMDLVRQTLDRHLGGMKSYGMRGYKEGVGAGQQDAYPYDSLDTFPSLVIAASDYVESTADIAWLKRNYAGVKAWAERMVGFDSDNDGLIESPLTGDANSWRTTAKRKRPANWWDTIGYGHKDAYSNALAYRAFQGMSAAARKGGEEADAQAYAGRAARLKQAYQKTFLDPATGVLAGWVSADGKMHDYWFTSVNGLAVASGLVDTETANRIMDRMLAKMKEVGYRNFKLGLPGNLIPVRREDYVEADHRFGGSMKEDGSDGFQIYENGGATACHAYWTIQALYNLGRRGDAERILFPMLKAFEEGSFQGRAKTGTTYDWKSWDGKPHGYEGLLVDNFLTLLAVYTGHLGK
jgi:hypothetical protein